MPGRDCDTCRYWRPHEGRLARTFGKCMSSKKADEIQHYKGVFVYPLFAETCRAVPELCGPGAAWWEGKPPRFELVEDEARQLDWDEPPDDET
jgi:hypothetical protein